MAKKTPATVHHAELFGLRKHKYAWLNDHDVSDTEWDELQPPTPFYLMRPVDAESMSEYEDGWPIAAIQAVATVGIVTGQDAKTIAFAKEGAKVLANVFGLDHSCIQPILYRPFDIRQATYHPDVVTRHRMTVMQHMLTRENVGLIVTRQTRDDWDCYVTETICGHKSCAAYDINTLFPLYLYPVAEGLFADSPWPEGKEKRRPNLSKVFVDEFVEKVGLEFVSDGRGDLEATFGPEDVFHYMYAVFHSPTYRERYAEFLKIDFPRLPLTGDADLLRTLCGLGERLVKLHLLEDVPESPVQFPEAGDNEVDKPRYTEPGTAGDTGRVYINKTQYFDHVPPAVWAFCVGGYQVCQKWLKDRKGRQLTYDDITHYRHVVAALGETIQLMADIDEVIPNWPIT